MELLSPSLVLRYVSEMTAKTPKVIAPEAPPPTAAVAKAYAPIERGEGIVINVPGGATSPGSDGWSDTAATFATSWAWPITVIVVLLIFKAPITRFIDRLRSFKGAGMEATTESMINEELPAREAPPESPQPGPHTSPIEAIVLAWVELEKAARDAVMRAELRGVLGAGRAAYSTVLRNVEALDRVGMLALEVRPLVVDLAKIRNQAIHRPEEPISDEALGKFLGNAAWATGQLKLVKAGPA